MTIITILVLMVCLAWCWYVMHKQNEKLRHERNNVDIEADKLDKQAFELYEELKKKNEKIKELCVREGEVLEAWAELKCNKHINLWLGHVTQGNRPQYVVYEIKGVEIISRYGTASKMWELVNSNREIYTDYKKAQQVLREQLEKGLQGEKEKEKEELAEVE